MLCRFPRSHTLWTFKVGISPTFTQVNHSEWWHGGAPSWGRKPVDSVEGWGVRTASDCFRFCLIGKLGGCLIWAIWMTVSYDLWISWLRSLRVLWTCMYNSWYTYVPLATYSCLHAHKHTYLHTGSCIAASLLLACPAWGVYHASLGLINLPYSSLSACASEESFEPANLHETPQRAEPCS